MILRDCVPFQISRKGLFAAVALAAVALPVWPLMSSAELGTAEAAEAGSAADTPATNDDSRSSEPHPKRADAPESASSEDAARTVLTESGSAYSVQHRKPYQAAQLALYSEFMGALYPASQHTRYKHSDSIFREPYAPQGMLLAGQASGNRTTTITLMRTIYKLPRSKAEKFATLLKETLSETHVFSVEVRQPADTDEETGKGSAEEGRSEAAAADASLIVIATPEAQQAIGRFVDLFR